MKGSLYIFSFEKVLFSEREKDMLFNSYIFVLLFLPSALLVYFAFNNYGWHKAALWSLTIMSFIFYAYNNVKYVCVLGISIVINWIIANLLLQTSETELPKTKKRYNRKWILQIGILINVGSIFYYKYLNFFMENINRLCAADFRLQNIILPLGISFFTFQQISYLVDSYRGETRGYTFTEYAAFVSFFPQLVAGPIVLHNEIIPQLRDKNRKRFKQENFAHGIYIFATGLFKKVLIADTFGKAVSWGWSNIETMTSLEILIVMLSYTFQIYFDFSGYCDMAVGIGRMFNMEFPINFNSPYKSYSVLEFWKKWHITLTRFLRNYIYYPLGGSKKGKLHTYVNILVVFLISGIWHGANWTFILWGGAHGFAQILNRIFKNIWDRCNPVFQWICTFGFINIMWLFFRADNIKQAVILIKRMAAMDTLTINNKLYDTFMLEEIKALEEYVRPLSYLREHIPGLYMWIALAGALFICLNMENLHVKKFKQTFFTAFQTVIMLVWSIISFAGVSIFLYFNF